MINGNHRGPAELRKFGLSFGAAMLIVGSIMLWRGKAAWPFLYGVAALVVTLALAAPLLLGPLEALLARLLRALTSALTYVVLTLTFALVMVPLGLLLRLFRWDPLAIRPDPKATSFWTPVEPDGPTTRPDKPY